MRALRLIVAVLLTCVYFAPFAHAASGAASSEEFVVEGFKRAWMDRSVEALKRARFEKIDVNIRKSEVSAVYDSFTIGGSITLGFTQEESKTRIRVQTMGALDNFYSIFSSPSDRIMEKFKNAFAEEQQTAK